MLIKQHAEATLSGAQCEAGKPLLRVQLCVRGPSDHRRWCQIIRKHSEHRLKVPPGQKCPVRPVQPTKQLSPSPRWEKEEGNSQKNECRTQKSRCPRRRNEERSRRAAEAAAPREERTEGCQGASSESPPSLRSTEIGKTNSEGGIHR